MMMMMMKMTIAMMVKKMNSRVLSLMAATALAHSAFAATFETDRTWYLAGEPMLVSVTDDTPQPHNSAPTHQIAYAELCDTHDLAAGVIISLHAGRGTGTIELPADLHSGYYQLSVYTRNDAQVSHRLVAVINPLHRSEDDDIEWVNIAHPDSLSYPATDNAPGQSLPIRSLSTLRLPPSAIPVDEREIEGHIVKARVKNTYDGRTFSSSQIRPSLSIVGKQIHYFEGKMVNDTLALFYTYDVHGRQPIVLSAMSSTGESLPIEVISPYALLLPKRLPHLVFHYKRSEVEARSVAMQQHQSVIATDRRELQLGDHAAMAGAGDEYQTAGEPSDYDATAFGTKPDLSYNLDEYRQFLTIREVLLEYVNFVSKRKINGVPRLTVHIDNTPSNLASLVLIDGMPVIDIERLLNYDARRIHYINIYGNLYALGNSVYNGILSFITRSGQLTNYPTEPNVQYLVYDFPE